MKLDTAEMVLLFGEGQYEVIIGRIAEHFGIAIPVDPRISVVDNSSDSIADKGVLAAQIWGPQSVYEWSNLYGFQAVVRGSYFYEGSLGPYRVYR